MAKLSNQKLKLLVLKDYLEKYSDEDHVVRMSQIIDHLAANGISAERKSIYNDIETLRSYGVDIETGAVDKTTGYFIANRKFQTAELKLLVDAVQCSRFITHKKSYELIKKLEELTSCHIARTFQRQVLVNDRIKHMNESIYYNTDKIHNAIAENKKISFKYFEYNLKKEYVFRKNGAKYLVSPLVLVWNDSNYYMVGFDSESKMIRNYRVDKMMNISVTNEKREGLDRFDSEASARYTQKMFSMYNGREQNIKLWFANHLVGVVIDRFGKDISIYPNNDGFIINVNVMVSPQFFGWLAGLGKDAKITAPAAVSQQYKEHLRRIINED